MKTAYENIILAGLAAGALDAIAAVVFLAKMNAAAVFKFVASGLFGKRAFTGGNLMICYGVLLHLLIAVLFSFLYALAFHWFGFFANNKITGGIIYGLLVWAIMNYVVLPLSNTATVPFNFTDAVAGAIIIILCVGIPIACLVRLK